MGKVSAQSRNQNESYKRFKTDPSFDMPSHSEARFRQSPKSERPIAYLDQQHIESTRSTKSQPICHVSINMTDLGNPHSTNTHINSLIYT